MQSNLKWPKKLPELTPEQIKISDDFMLHWLQILSKKYRILDKFNHGYSVKNSDRNFVRTLEIGAGNGEHLKYENLTQEQQKNYWALELRDNVAQELKKNASHVNVLVGDCQTKISIEDGFFDRILAIHILEHLPNLPAAIKEIYRLCNKEKGVFSIVIPCEGGMAYSFARKISAQRIFEKRYKQPYDWLIKREHINKPYEIFEELAPYFDIQHIHYFPFNIKMEWCNLVIGMTLRPKYNI